MLKKKSLSKENKNIKKRNFRIEKDNNQSKTPSRWAQHQNGEGRRKNHWA